MVGAFFVPLAAVHRRAHWQFSSRSSSSSSTESRRSPADGEPVPTPPQRVRGRGLEQDIRQDVVPRASFAFWEHQPMWCRSKTTPAEPQPFEGRTRKRKEGIVRDIQLDFGQPQESQTE